MVATMKILPTHTCFDDALDFLTAQCVADPTAVDNFVLVHAILLAPEGPSEGRPFAHAWVEVGDIAWLSGVVDGRRVYYAVKQVEYYAQMRPISMTKYSAQAAVEENYKHHNFGPWQPEYIALCGSSREQFFAYNAHRD
jgi:hypothetical protein